MIIGIDIGTNGGFCVLDNKGKIIDKWVMPHIGTELDTPEIINRLQPYLDGYCIMEKVTARPGQGVCTMFAFGRNLGIIEGVLATLKIKYYKVPPANWVKVMHEGIKPIRNNKGRRDTKKMSLIAINQLFPNESFLATPRCKVKHSGLVDAALIAEYWRTRLHK